VRIPEENLKPSEINVVPLIDVIFSILVFFIVTSLVLTRTESLDVDLPGASSAERQKSPVATISITKDGQVAVNRLPVTMDQLIPAVEQALKDEKISPEARKKPFILISADLAITHGKFVEVSDRLRPLARSYDVTFGVATQPIEN
jgi:biopolymer transport protein ExbD